MSRESYRKFCFKYKYSYCVPENFKLTRGITDEEGERSLERLRASLPSEAQTRYNQRDIKRYKERNEKLRNTRTHL
jgi:hypothetical protein